MKKIKKHEENVRKEKITSNKAYIKRWACKIEEVASRCLSLCVLNLSASKYEEYFI